MKRIGMIFMAMICLGTWCRAQGLQLPQVPDSIKEVGARADYVTKHFWQHYDFQDTSLLRVDYAEQALADFIGLLKFASPDGREQAVKSWLDAAAANATVYDYFVEQARLYLHERNSPQRDEELYRLTAQHVVSCPVADEMQRSRAQLLLRLAERNRVGEPATDFLCLTNDGKRQRMTELSRSPLTLLLFYDPDCEQCQDLLFRLHHSGLINSAIKEQRLTLIAVDCGALGVRSEELGVRSEEGWVMVVADDQLQEGMLYDLTTLPVLYLLDADKKVIQKESDIHQVVEYLIVQNS
ncbi:MAG: DUF5106 domain-containing protein [Prevotella sp.]|jgi:hypothetical protein|nr:DUF5106 domain-containing protein [Prevotella sp.]